MFGMSWVTEPRAGTPTMFIKRRPLGVALTDRRLLLIENSGSQALTADDVIWRARLSVLRLEKIRRWTPLLHLRIRQPDGGELIFEFRPRYRPLSAAIIESIPQMPATGVQDDPAVHHDPADAGEPTDASALSRAGNLAEANERRAEIPLDSEEDFDTQPVAVLDPEGLRRLDALHAAGWDNRGDEIGPYRDTQDVSSRR